MKKIISCCNCMPLQYLLLHLWPKMSMFCAEFVQNFEKSAHLCRICAEFVQNFSTFLLAPESMHASVVLHANQGTCFPYSNWKDPALRLSARLRCSGSRSGFRSYIREQKFCTFLKILHKFCTFQNSAHFAKCRPFEGQVLPSSARREKSERHKPWFLRWKK